MSDRLSLQLLLEFRIPPALAVGVRCDSFILNEYQYSGTDGKAKNLDNLIIVRVKVPPRRCSDDSITPTVATSPQPVKRGEKAVTGSLIWKSAEQESMDNASEDVSELSSHAK